MITTIFKDVTYQDEQERQAALRGYCDELRESLEEEDYVVVHGRDFRAYRDAEKTGDYSYFSGKISVAAKMISIFESAEYFPEDREFIADMINNDGAAYCDPSEKMISLPDEDKGLLYMCELYGLDIDVFHQAGMSDIDGYAVRAIHEFSHVMGNDGLLAWNNEDSSVLGEGQVYALETARVAKFMSPEALQFMRDSSAFEVLMNCFSQKNNSFPYVWAASAQEWVMSRVANDENFWDAGGDAFPERIFQAFSRLGSAKKRTVVARPFDVAYAALENYTSIDDFDRLDGVSRNLELRDAALKASVDLRAEGNCLMKAGKDHQKPFQAALILRQLARSIDGVMHYSKDYRPVPQDQMLTHRFDIT